MKTTTRNKPAFKVDSKVKNRIKAIERDINSIQVELEEANNRSGSLFQESQRTKDQKQLPKIRSEIQESQHEIKRVQAKLAYNYSKLAELKRLEASGYEHKANELQTQCPLAL